jgi:hypothetical protein
LCNKVIEREKKEEAKFIAFEEFLQMRRFDTGTLAGAQSYVS